MPLIKSDEGWRRYREKTNNGAMARRADSSLIGKPSGGRAPAKPALPKHIPSAPDQIERMGNRGASRRRRIVGHNGRTI